MSFTIEKKEKTRELLRTYCDRFPNIENAANSLNNVSQTTIYNILRGKFDSIRDVMFRSILAQISEVVEDRSGWQLVGTPASKDVYFALRDSHLNNNTTWVISPAGSGKSATAKQYRRDHKNVFYVLCDHHMKESDFVAELAKAVGLRLSSKRKIRENLLAVIDEIGDLDDALIILDEGDKLHDRVLYFFITIYNLLEDKAGIVFLSTSFIESRIDRGLNRGAKGYEEIHSRLCRNYYYADTNTENDVRAICETNGVNNEADIRSIVTDTARFGYDLRRVKKRVKAMRDKAANRIDVE